MHAKLAGGVYRQAQAVVVEHLLQPDPGFNAADTHGFAGFGILQCKQVQAGFRRAALVEGIPGPVDFTLQQFPVGRQGGQAFAGVLSHRVQVVQVACLQRSDQQHVTPSPVR